uniref:Uncharacterized protein n=1 Tax=Anguilla anguilla TaxID=7936 RepID=A0A0E9PQY8_ANGAN
MIHENPLKFDWCTSPLICTIKMTVLLPGSLLKSPVTTMD